MLKCNLCQSWFHSKCLGFDDKNISYYFENFKEFNCLDCYLSDKYKERYMEVTFVKYLEVLKMSYIVMCFSKLVMIILKSISKDSNIKLHSKLLKAFLKENYNVLLKDKNICLLLELIRMDIFILKDKEAHSRKKNIDNLINNTVNSQNANINLNKFGTNEKNNGKNEYISSFDNNKNNHGEENSNDNSKSIIFFFLFFKKSL